MWLRKWSKMRKQPSLKTAVNLNGISEALQFHSEDSSLKEDDYFVNTEQPKEGENNAVTEMHDLNKDPCETHGNSQNEICWEELRIMKSCLIEEGILMD